MKFYAVKFTEACKADSYWKNNHKPGEYAKFDGRAQSSSPRLYLTPGKARGMYKSYIDSGKAIVVEVELTETNNEDI